MKKHILYSLALAIGVGVAHPAAAACYADYKAKRDNPLRLHYGVVQVSDAACSQPSVAKTEIQAKISQDNWRLLTVMSFFDENGLKERQKSAGEYFLRY